jgi:polyribonucleotide nucleotidyltransferase
LHFLPPGVQIRRCGVETTLTARCVGDERREKLLDVAERVLAAPNTQLKASAPRFATVAVPREMLGKVIGPQGSNVKSIERDTSCRVSILQDTGEVSIFAPSSEALAEASRRIQVIRAFAYPNRETGD